MACCQYPQSIVPKNEKLHPLHIEVSRKNNSTSDRCSLMAPAEALDDRQCAQRMQHVLLLRFCVENPVLLLCCKRCCTCVSVHWSWLDLCSCFAVWELLTRDRPFKGLLEGDLVVGVCDRGLRPVFPPHSPPSYVALAQQCWAEDPAQRPTAVQVRANAVVCFTLHRHTCGNHVALSHAAK